MRAQALASAGPGAAAGELAPFRRARPSGCTTDQLSLHGLTWCVQVYLPSCLRLLALERRAHHLAHQPALEGWQQVPPLGLAIWDLAQQWQLTAPALGSLDEAVSCLPICQRLRAAKTPALTPALDRLGEVTSPGAGQGAETLLARHWPPPSSRPDRALTNWTIQRELRAGGPPAAVLTVAMINRLGDELAHAAASMAVRLAAASGLTAHRSAQPLSAAHTALESDSSRQGWPMT